MVVYYSLGTTLITRPRDTPQGLSGVILSATSTKLVKYYTMLTGILLLTSQILTYVGVIGREHTLV